jgi:hypothetical protein
MFHHHAFTQLKQQAFVQAMLGRPNIPFAVCFPKRTANE